MRFAKIVFLLTLVLLASAPLLPQTPVAVSNFPNASEPTKVFIYSGTNLAYACTTKPIGPWNNGSVASSFSWTRAASTLTSIVVSSDVGTVTTSTAHGLRVGNTVVVAGATVDTDLNGTYIIQTAASSTTFTITTVSVANATYNESTLTLTTSAPRSTAAIWAISKFLYDASSNLIANMWANGVPTFVNVCDSASTLSYR